jgi:hypothetical protein
MMFGGDLMGATARARAMEAKERAKKAEELKKKKLAAKRIRKETIKGILAACIEDDAKKCKPEIECSPVAKPKRRCVHGKKKGKKRNGAKKPKKEKNNVEEDLASDEPELGTGELGNSPPKGDPALASPTETSQSLPVSRINRASRPSAVDDNGMDHKAKIIIELEDLSPDFLSTLLSQIQVDEQSLHTINQALACKRKNNQILNASVSSRTSLSPNSLPSKPSPRPYNRSSIDSESSTRSERSTENRRSRRPSNASVHSCSLSPKALPSKPQYISPRPYKRSSSIGNMSTRSEHRSTENRRSRRGPRGELSESRHRREIKLNTSEF